MPRPLTSLHPCYLLAPALSANVPEGADVARAAGHVGPGERSARSRHRTGMGSSDRKDGRPPQVGPAGLGPNRVNARRKRGQPPMPNSIVDPVPSTALTTTLESQRPLVTRGPRHEQEKRRRRRTRVPRDTLVLGIDLARERQAASFSHDGQVLNRRRLGCAAHEIDRFLPEAETLAKRHGLAGSPKTS